MRFKKLKLLLIGLLSGGLLLSACSNIDIDDENYSINRDNEDTTYYRVDFVNYDESYLYSTYVVEGEFVKYQGPNPTRDATDMYTYTFIGWDTDPYATPITQNTRFVAQYEATLIHKCIVQFVNYDGTILYETVVNSGEDAFYVGDTPTRPTDDDGTTYIFSGWNKSIEDVQEDIVVVALYESRQGRFTVTFVNYDGQTILGIEYAYRGDSVTYHGETPYKPPYQAEAYQFTGWDVELSDIQSDLVATAQFTTVDRIITVTFHDYAGEVIYSTNAAYGAAVTYHGSTPTKPFSGRYEYVFRGWNKDLDCVQYDIDVFPEFTEQVRTETTGLNFEAVYGQGSSNVIAYRLTYYNGSLKDVYVPSTHNGKPIIEIYANAFNKNHHYYSANLETVFIDDGVTTIGNNVFSYCSYLKSVRLPEGITSLPSSLFYNCTSMQKIELPATITSITRSNFDYINSTFELTISNKNTTYSVDGPFVLSKNGETLYFAYKTLSGEVSVPSGVKTIKQGFLGSNSVSTLNFPKSLREIESYAVTDNYSLRIVNFNFAAVSLADNAFSGCYYLNELKNYSNVKDIGQNAFNGSSLTEFIIYPALQTLYYNSFGGAQIRVTLQAESDYFDSIDNIIYTEDHTTIVHIPWGNLGTIHLPKELEYFDTNVYINGSRTITAFEVESGNSNYYSLNGCLYNGDKTTLLYVARNIQNLTEVPSQTTRVHSYASRNNSGLKTIDFSNSNITTLESYCFYNCENLTDVKVKIYGNSSYFTSVNENGSYVFADCYKLKNVTFLSGSNAVPRYTFNGCSSLQSVTLNSVTTIYESAFYNCSALTTVSLPSSLTTIKENAFYSCSSLTNISLPSSLTSIGYCAFYCCTSLPSISIPNSVTSLGSSAFAQCTHMASLTISNKLTSVPSDCFSNCISLTSVTLPDSITSIGDNSFYYCTSLSSVTFPSNLKTISSYAFYYCAFRNLTIPNTVTSIGYNAFYYCTSLVNLTLSSNLTSIGSSAFYGCSSLTSLTIPSKVTNIEGSAFANCTSLTNLTIPSSVTSISDSAFYNTGITNITIPSTVTYLGGNAFSYCNSLETVTINSTSVGSSYSGAFSYSTSLKNVYWNVNSSSSYSSGPYYTFSGCQISKFVLATNVTSFNLDFLSGSSKTSDCSFRYNASTTLSTYYGSTPTFGNVYFNGTLTEYLQRTTFYQIQNTSSNFYYRSSSGAYTFESSSYAKIGDRVEIPNSTSITRLYQNEFYGFQCTTLKLSENVTRIDNNALYNSNINTVITGSKIKYIGNPYKSNIRYFVYTTPAKFNTNVNSSGGGCYSGADLYFYSDQDPEKAGLSTDYNYWHYDSSNNPVIWTN